MAGGALVAPRGGGVVDGVQLAFAVTLASSSSPISSSSRVRWRPTVSASDETPTINRGRRGLLKKGKKAQAARMLKEEGKGQRWEGGAPQFWAARSPSEASAAALRRDQPIDNPAAISRIKLGFWLARDGGSYRPLDLAVGARI